MDRNGEINARRSVKMVALRKESVDRNHRCWCPRHSRYRVALRKESVDRNKNAELKGNEVSGSLSARRAWIEM